MKKIIFLVLAIALFAPVSAVIAAGEFDYIVIRGPGITGEINVSNPFFTEDIFTFADFSKGNINPPSDPGQGYQIVRMHADGSKGIPYDQLHYYPYTGYVYYDGIVNGFSEDGGKWYLANPEIEQPFRAILAEDARLTWIPFAVLAVLLTGFFVAYQMKPKQPN